MIIFSFIKKYSIEEVVRFYINNRIKRLSDVLPNCLLLNVIKEENIMEDKSLFYKGFSDSTIADTFFQSN